LLNVIDKRDIVLERDTEEAVHVALDRLQIKDRAIWWLVACGYEKREVAKMFGYTPEWVSIRIRKTRSFLRDCLLMALG
jgi:DNA-directed RNA polymerase specialized sigma24 family protein